jgi:channel protein (hemolysin III family)
MELGMLSSHPQRSNGWLGFTLENKAERFNTISALSGAIAAISGVAWLVTLAVRQGDPWKIASFSIYGVTLVSVYVFATLYQGFEVQRYRNVR